MDIFEGKTWLIYGKLAMSKQEIKEAIAARGGRVVSSISAKLGFLLWDGETLAPGDEVSASKPSKMLKQGGLVVGEADFMDLLKGKTSKKIERHLNQGTGLAKKAPKASKKKTTKTAGPQPLSPEQLLAQTVSTLAQVDDVRRTRTVEAAIACCTKAGRGDCALELANGLAESMRGLGLMAAADGDKAIVEQALPLLGSTYKEMDDYDRGDYALRLFEIGHRHPQWHPKMSELVDLAQQDIDAAIEKGSGYSLEPFLEALMQLGSDTKARSLLLRVRDLDPSMLADMNLRSGALRLLAEEPQEFFSVLEHMDSHRSEQALCADGVLQSISHWDLTDLQAVAEQKPEYFLTDLGKALAAAGRVEEARSLLFPKDGPEVLLATKVKRHAILGELDEAKALLRGEEPSLGEWTSLRLEHGVESFGEVLTRYEQHPQEHIMSDTERRIRLGRQLLERGELDLVEKVLSSVDTLLASNPALTSYDLGVQADRLGALADLRVEYLGQKGDASAVRTQLEADLSGLKDLQDLSAKNQKDPSMRTFGKNEVAKRLVARAGRAGQLDIALKAAKKISKKEREEIGGEVALWWLPADPGGALATFESVVGQAAQERLIPGTPSQEAAESTFFVALWLAVFAS